VESWTFFTPPGYTGPSGKKAIRITILGILSFTLALPRQGVSTKYRLDKVLMRVGAKLSDSPYLRFGDRGHLGADGKD
jgi:hypothetical protein